MYGKKHEYMNWSTPLEAQRYQDSRRHKHRAFG